MTPVNKDIKIGVTTIAILLLVCLVGLWWMVQISTPKIGDIVPCSDYHQIKDIYATPGSGGDQYFMVLSDGSTIELEVQNYALLERRSKNYVYRDHLLGEFWIPSNITPIYKEGYRDTCEVI